MTPDWILFLTFAIFLVGFGGCFLPFIPAAPLIFAGVLIYKLAGTENDFSWILVGLFGVMALLAQVMDFLCTCWGAKRFGASWRGILGAILGLILGPLFMTPLPGIVFGPVFGAIGCEFIGGRDLRASTKAGVGTIVGGMVAFAIRLFISTLMIGIFVLKTWPQA